MNIYIISGILALSAALLTAFRYVVQRPTSLWISFVQTFVGVVFVFSGFIKENDPVGFSYKLEEYFEVFQTTDSVKNVSEVPVMGTDTVAVYFKNLKTGELRGFTADSLPWRDSSNWKYDNTATETVQVGVEKVESWTTVKSDSFYNSVMDFFHRKALFLAVLVLVFEIMLGFLLLTGTAKKLVIWLSLLMILFFTFLTFYSAYYNKVTDCGCFGDFLHLTPWTSFYKDVVLLALILVLFAGQKHISRLLTPGPEKVVLGAFAAFSILFPVYTYNFMPVFDFRPYKIGTNISEAMKVPPGGEGKFETNVYYENLKTGEKKAFPPNNLPWKDSLTWKYDTTITVTLVEPVLPPVHDFTINTPEGSEYTEDFLTHTGPQFWLVCYDLSKTNKNVIAELNDFAALCKKEEIPFICLTSSTNDMIDSFKKETNASFDFYITDGTQLKTMIRANPGLILLNGSVVTAMWHYHTLPAYSDVKQKYFNK